ncbi:Hint domain-containing protein [Streptomyces synnematoformans]|uniref:Hint domain-containing protein n=1 Tax=Streptomyces synnematoformans TaxID=415721 RepID=A0ABP5IZ02_9ACTN
MANAALALAFRRRQALLVARMISRVVQAWRDLVDPARVDAAWPSLRALLEAEVRQTRLEAGRDARDAYLQARSDAGIPGTLILPDPPPLAETRLRGTLDVTGPVEFKRAVAAGKTSAQAVDAAAVRLAGSAQYLAAEGGRSVIRDAIDTDERATGWARVTDGDPCAWCAMLASRGPVYKSAGTAGRDQNARFEGDGEFKYHDHCVPAGTLVDGPAAEVGYRRHYEGEMVLVRTAAGHELRITPNHPVLTDAGWVPAGLLREGDRVLSSFHAQGSLLQVPDEEQVPARAEDVWGALSVFGLVRVPGTPEDFHGDGTHGEVDVVRADGLLRDEAGTQAAELVAELELALAGMAQGLLATPRPGDGLFQSYSTATGGGVGGLDLLTALLLAEPSHDELGDFARRSPLHASFIEHARDHAAGDAVLLGEREHGHPSLIGGRDLVDRDHHAVAAPGDPSLLQFPREHAAGHAGSDLHLLAGFAGEVETHRLVEPDGIGLGQRTRFDPPPLDFLAEGASAYAGLGRDLRERLAGRVELDRVVDLHRIEFSGHVYNFQTVEGWYRASNIIVSNCACQAWPAFTMNEPFIGIAEQLYDDWLTHTRGRGGRNAVNAFRRWWEAEGRAAYTSPRT